MIHILGRTVRRFLACSLAAVVGVLSLAPAIRIRAADTPSAASSQAAPPDVTAQTAAVVDAATGQVYYDKNMHQQMYPASITKIMTGLLAVERGKSSDVVTVQSDIGKSQSKEYTNIALQPGEQMTEDELLYTMFLASANDSAQALAEQIGGSVPNFIAMMNARVKELGGTDTSFSNPNGLPDVNNKTSAYDMALIASQAVKLPDLLKYFGAETYTLPATNKRAKPEQFTTLVKMLRHDSQYYYSGIVAAKSGWTVMSGWTLVTAAKRNGRTVVCVVMKSSDSSTVMTESQKLLDYAFTQKQIAPQKSSGNVHTEEKATAAAAPGKSRETAAPDSQTKTEMALTALCAGAVLVMLVIVRWRTRARRRV